MSEPRLPVSDYARGPSDPIKLAGITVSAVDLIGSRTAAEICTLADSIEAGAKEIGDKLRTLAKAISEHSMIASGHVAEFCEKSTNVLETIRDLENKLNGNAHQTTTTSATVLPSPADDGEPIPQFLTEASGQGEGRDYMPE